MRFVQPQYSISANRVYEVPTSTKPSTRLAYHVQPHQEIQSLIPRPHMLLSLHAAHPSTKHVPQQHHLPFTIKTPILFTPCMLAHLIQGMHPHMLRLELELRVVDNGPFHTGGINVQLQRINGDHVQPDKDASLPC